MIRWSLSNRLPLLRRGAQPGGWGRTANDALARIDAGLDATARVPVDGVDVLLEDVSTLGGGSAAIARRVVLLRPGLAGAILRTAAGPKLQHIANRSGKAVRLAGPDGLGRMLHPGDAGWFMAQPLRPLALERVQPQLRFLRAPVGAAPAAAGTALLLTRLAQPMRLAAWALAAQPPPNTVWPLRLDFAPEVPGSALPAPPPALAMTTRSWLQTRALDGESGSGPLLPAGAMLRLVVDTAVPAPVAVAMSLLLIPVEAADA